MLLLCGCCRDLLRGQEDEKGNWGRTSRRVKCTTLTVTLSVMKKQDATENNVCAWISKRNSIKWVRTFPCPEERFCNQRTFQWSKSERCYQSFVQKMYFNSLLGDYKRRTNFCSYCDSALLCLCPLHSIPVCVFCLRHPAFVPSNVGKNKVMLLKA